MTLILLARLYARTGQDQKAINFLNQLSGFTPSDIQVIKEIADILVQKGKCPSAKEIYKLILSNGGSSAGIAKKFSRVINFFIG